MIRELHIVLVSTDISVVFLSTAFALGKTSSPLIFAHLGLPRAASVVNVLAPSLLARRGSSSLVSICRIRILKFSRMRTYATHQVVKDAFVQLALRTPAVPQLVVVVVQTIPVLSEFLKTVCVEVLQSVSSLS